MTKTIVIGDVHGCYLTLVELLKKLPWKTNIIFTGDLIDRGPRSAEVLRLVLDPVEDFKTVIGNHEDLFRGFYPAWLESLGKDAYYSFDNDAEIAHFRRMLKGVPYFIEPDVLVNARQVLVCHAGLQRDTIKASIEDLSIIWGFGEVVNNPEFYQVFGHREVTTPIITDYYACIDTGVYKRNGKLTALELPSMKIYQQKNIDKLNNLVEVLESEK